VENLYLLKLIYFKTEENLYLFELMYFIYFDYFKFKMIKYKFNGN